MKLKTMVGFLSEQCETSPGVYTDIMVERPYYGESKRRSKVFSYSEGINTNLELTNTISIIADQYAFEQYYAITYATFKGAKWIVKDVSVEPPRLILTLGGLYHEG